MNIIGMDQIRIWSAIMDCENPDLYMINIIGLARRVVPTAIGSPIIIRYLTDLSYEIFNNSLEDIFNLESIGNIALT